MAAARLSVLAAAAVAVAAAAALPLLAADDCFDSCFKHCIGYDKSMTDYCNYACGMTCGGGGSVVDGALRTMINCQLACVRDPCRRFRASGDGNKDMEACYGQCYDGCETNKAGLPRPLRAGTGAVGAAALPDHPFFHHEMQDAVQPTSEPDPDTVQPTSEPDPDDASRRSRGSFLP